METGKGKSILEEIGFGNPSAQFQEAVGALKINSETHGNSRAYGAIVDYFQKFISEESQGTVKDPAHQLDAQDLLQRMIDEGYRNEAELVFNTHRVLTEFRGYGANESASSDVEACFGEEFEIPEEGVIVVDRFVTRNLPSSTGKDGARTVGIIEMLEKRGVDLGRIRVRCPKMLFAAQIMGMSDEKREEFLAAVSKLNADQFLIEDVASSHDIALPKDEQIAVHFTPRTLPFRLDWHGVAGDSEDLVSVEVAEAETIDRYCEWVRLEVMDLVPGGRVFMNIAEVPEFEELKVTLEAARPGGRELAKPTQQISTKVADAIMECLGETCRMEDLVNPREDGPVEGYDHSKKIRSGHWRQPVEVHQPVEVQPVGAESAGGDWHTDIAGRNDGPRF